MASRAQTRVAPGWRVAVRSSAARAGRILGAAVLLLLGASLLLALLTYTQTDPSPSTAASGTDIGNWLGRPGAWWADRLYLILGWTALVVPLILFQGAAALWHERDRERGSWRQQIARAALLLLAGAVCLGTALTLLLGSGVQGLPAGAGGLGGLLGAQVVQALAATAGPASGGWLTVLIALAALAGGGAVLARLMGVGREHAVRLARALPLPPGRAAPGEAAAAADSAAVPAADPAPPVPEGDTPAPAPAEAAPRRTPTIADPHAAVRPAPPRPQQGDMFTDFALPPLDLLAAPTDEKVQPLDKLALERNARLLETVLDDFNVKGEITAVRTGPVVTMYELEPAPGIKASRVVGLAEDIARNMSAISARVSTIPGKTVMGIELPNAQRQTISYRELVASASFAEAKGALPIILGKDIAGEPIVADLAAMPHLLVAGTTGSGKSVGLNAILLSLLYRFSPAECRLILVDPKVLELKVYDDIPHLLSPVVTEPAKSVRALKWAVEEMERRYRMMSSVNSRNIGGFNEKVRAAAARGKPLGRRVQTGFDPETGEELFEEEQLDYQPLPLIVLIVDELADLMVTVGKEIEVLIQRLSQKSRAAGIHLIMATQRPSVDVITGVIKANLPTRISFKVTSRIDSRTILGEQGAEQLLGKGDMLYKPNTGATLRVHGPFVSDEEVERVADHWRAQGKPAYVDAVTEEPEDGGFAFGDDVTASDDPEERKYRQACQIVFEAQKASGSWLQRQMGVGYNTAAKWIERMESEGLVSAADHVGRREVFRDRDGNAL
ncbi:DNA translocase FtsK [Erythrobacteraceae bacterium CFH 75059]|uniref:FtsK/SpoIIIE family DNA translocase n=1 Tax=Qipengyuania thermophila TaxID=2509361 RepID=UPI00101EF495|nr:DNA translocase FtsK 4TM domain-containing protein [Qipengyuania thermophila]TCD06516.1 DNA translocase FtsK [Erythrobacteraceae bacterium CFH 75059]